MAEQTGILSLESALDNDIKKSQTLTWKYKLSLLGLFICAYFLFYVFPNFNPQDVPRELPLMRIDLSMPFLPWTFLVYLSEFLLIAAAIVMIKELHVFNSFARLSFTSLILVGSIFMFYPTSYPRPAYPSDENAFVAFAMNIIANADMPTNCFPSLHVAITSIAVASLRFLQPKLFALFVVWGVAIFTSTLTTKQHYFVDILGGFGLAMLVIVVDCQLFSKRECNKRHLDLAEADSF